MKHLLYIDTSDTKSLILLMTQDAVVAQRSNDLQTTHGQVINIHIQEILDETGISLHQLDGICVMNGPGSYTGLRISLSTAKGICYVTNTPLLLINKLDLLRQSACRLLGKKSVCVIMKARENEYFTAFYSATSELLDNYALLSKDDVIKKIEFNSSILCFEDPSCELDFEHHTSISLFESDIRKLCFEYFDQNKIADLLHCEPFYLKNVHINKINKL